MTRCHNSSLINYDLANSCKLKIERNKQREKPDKLGTVDPNQAQNQTPAGTCTSMCPEFERVERIVQKMVDKCEKVSIYADDL